MPAPRLEASRARARRFLLDLQDPDGAWRDFDLPPGPADAWVTAFVGLSLTLAGGPPEARTRGALDRAAAYLGGARAPGGGWGYNRRCPADADSTALACLFLAAAGEAARPRDLAVLAGFQHDDGAFATYRFGDPAHGWRGGHPEVTATALRALLPHLGAGHGRIRAGLAWLGRAQDQGGLTAYWWPTDWYLALELERLAAGAPALGSPRLTPGPEPVTSFDLALAAELQSIRSPGVRYGAFQRLLARQSADGSWPSEPILRLTDPRATAGHQTEAVASRLFEDRGRSFVTAAALSATAAVKP
ncbi:MAG: hypothetical protein H0X27_09935 [Caulobacteraceae bacterium]|nr:hypothetical protein [Caulobacteraceae bacterium]